MTSAATGTRTAAEIADEIDAPLVAGATACDPEIRELYPAYQTAPVLGV